MLIGKVVGTLVSTQKDQKLEGLRFMVVKPVSIDGVPSSSYVVAADAVGSGVDTWEVEGEVKYRKNE